MNSTIAAVACSFFLLGASTLVGASSLGRHASATSTLALAEARAGAALHTGGQYRAAIDRYRHAQQLLHQEEGVHTPSQLALVDWIAANHLLLGELKEADIQARFHYQIIIANYGDYSPAALAATVRLADWFQSSLQLSQARKLYERALTIIKRHGLDPRERIKPVSGLTHVRALQQNWLLKPSTGAMERRLRFSLKAQRAVGDPAAIAVVRGDYADWLARNGELTASRTMRRLASQGLFEAWP